MPYKHHYYTQLKDNGSIRIITVNVDHDFMLNNKCESNHFVSWIKGKTGLDVEPLGIYIDEETKEYIFSHAIKDQPITPSGLG